MADPFVVTQDTVFVGTAGSTALSAGDMVYFDGTDWELADADDETKFAEAMVVNSVASAEKVALVTRGLIVDADAPYTQGDQYFLSETAGAITATRPTTATALKQVVGFGLSTTEVRVEIMAPHEMSVSLTPMGDGATAFAQNGDYTGGLLGAAAEAVGYTCMVPENCVGLEIAYLWWTNGASAPALDASDTYTVDVSSAVDDETTTATTDGITAASLAVADNDLNRVDISAAFDAAGIIEPGNVLGIDVDKAAEGTAGDDPLMLTCVLVFLVV